MMGRSEGTNGHQAAIFRQLAGCGMDQRCFQRFFVSHGRQNTRQTASQHGFAAAGNAYHQQIVSPGCRYFQRLPGHRLTFDVLQIVSDDRRPLQFFKIHFRLKR